MNTVKTSCNKCRGTKTTNEDTTLPETITFRSYSAAAKWLVYATNTNLQPDTVARAVAAAVSSGKELYGYRWDAVDEVDVGVVRHNMDIKPTSVPETKAPTPITLSPIWNSHLQDRLVAENERIRKEREKVYDDSLGLKPVLNKNLPQYKHKQDILREEAYAIEEPLYNIAIFTDEGWMMANDIAEAIGLIKKNICGKDIREALDSGILCGKQIKIGNIYRQELENYYDKWDTEQ